MAQDAGEVVKAIRGFQGEHRWLSNFWPCTVYLDEELFPSVEHAYQASKTNNEGIRTEIREARSGGHAKRIARVRKLPRQEKARALSVMHHLLREKFDAHINPGLFAKLVGTEDALIVEENTWNDTFWGECDGRGENYLGRLLMHVRAEIMSPLNLSPPPGNVKW